MKIIRDESAWARDLFAAVDRIWGASARCQLGYFFKGGRQLLIFSVISPPGFLAWVFKPRYSVMIRITDGGFDNRLYPAKRKYKLELYDSNQFDAAKKLAAYIEQDTQQKVILEQRDPALDSNYEFLTHRQ